MFVVLSNPPIRAQIPDSISERLSTTHVCAVRGAVMPENQAFFRASLSCAMASGWC
jgi:hypothetical protein